MHLHFEIYWNNMDSILISKLKPTKAIYVKLIEKFFPLSDPTRFMWNSESQTDTQIEEWSQLYRKCMQITFSTKLRFFQY